MRIVLFIMFLLISLPINCMELSGIFTPEQAYNILVTNNPTLEKREAALHLNVLISLIYHAGYDHILSFFVHLQPTTVPIMRTARIVKATEIALNAYGYAIDSFLKTISEDNKAEAKRMPFTKLESLLGKEIEILNERYKPAMKALRALAPSRDRLTYPESISLEHFLLSITGYSHVKDAVTHFGVSSI